MVGALGEHVAAAVGEGDIAGLIRPHTEADPHQIARYGVEAPRFGVKRHHARGEGAGDPCVEGRHGLHAFVEGAVYGLVRYGGGGGFGRGRLRVQLVAAFGAATAFVEAAQQGVEAMGGEEGRQWLARHGGEGELFQRHRQRRVLLQLHQTAREAGHVGLLDQAVAQLAGFHGGGCGEGALQRAVFLDQLGGGLGADAANAGDIVGAVAHQGQHIADQIRPDAEFFDDFRGADADVFHGIQHVGARAVRADADQLHQVLVAGDDGDVPALAGGLARVGGDDVVGLQPLFLDTGQAEGAGGVANQGELGDQVLGRRRTVRLVFRVHVVAERFARFVEDYRQMGRAVRLVQVLGQFPQHRRIAINRADGGAGGVGQRRQAVIGAENIGRAINQIEMRANGGCFGRGFGRGFGHGAFIEAVGGPSKAASGG